MQLRAKLCYCRLGVRPRLYASPVCDDSVAETACDNCGVIEITSTSIAPFYIRRHVLVRPVTDSSAEVAPAAAKLQSPKVLCVNELYDFFSRAIKHGGMTHNGLCTGHIRKLSGGRTILRRREDILKALSPHKCYSTCHEMDSIYASSAPNSI